MLLDFSEREEEWGGREKRENWMAAAKPASSRGEEFGRLGIVSYHGVRVQADRQLAAAAAACSLSLFSAFMAPVFGKTRGPAFLSHPNAASFSLSLSFAPVFFPLITPVFIH